MAPSSWKLDLLVGKIAALRTSDERTQIDPEAFEAELNALINEARGLHPSRPANLATLGKSIADAVNRGA